MSDASTNSTPTSSIMSCGSAIQQDNALTNKLDDNGIILVTYRPYSVPIEDTSSCESDNAHVTEKNLSLPVELLAVYNFDNSLEMIKNKNDIEFVDSTKIKSSVLPRERLSSTSSLDSDSESSVNEPISRTYYFTSDKDDQNSVQSEENDSEELVSESGTSSEEETNTTDSDSEDDDGHFSRVFVVNTSSNYDSDEDDSLPVSELEDKDGSVVLLKLYREVQEDSEERIVNFTNGSDQDQEGYNGIVLLKHVHNILG